MFQNLDSQKNWEYSGQVDEDYEKFISQLKECANLSWKVAPNRRGRRISEETKDLIEKRKMLKRDGKDKLEYAILCKLIRQRIREDHEKFRLQQLKKTAELKTNVALKSAKNADAIPVNNNGS